MNIDTYVHMTIASYDDSNIAFYIPMDCFCNDFTFLWLGKKRPDVDYPESFDPPPESFLSLTTSFLRKFTKTAGFCEHP